MPILTIDLPEAEYRVALALPESERQRVIVNAFATARNIPNDETTAEDIAAIGESLEDEAAGRVIDGDTARQQIRERFGWQKK